MDNCNFHYNIYKNILAFVKFRYGEDIAPVSKKEIFRDIERDKYIKITVKNGEVIILFMESGDKYDILNLATRVMLYQQLAKNTKELMVIMDTIFKKDYLPLIEKFLEDFDRPGVDLLIRPLTIFYSNVPKNKQIPKHYIEDQEMVNKAFKLTRIEKSAIPKIKLYIDPYTTWLGAKEGDIITVERPSPSVGQQIFYREVI